MADNTIDTLELRINSNAGKATDSLDRLAETLLKLKNSLGGGWIGNIKDLSSNLHSLSGATKKLDTGKLTGFAVSLGKLSSSVTAFSAVSGNITPAINNLQKLSAFDFSKLRLSGDFSGLGTLAQGMGELANVAPRLASLKASEISRTLKAFERIGSVDFSATVQSLQTLNGIDTTGFSSLIQSMTGFSDAATKLSSLKTADVTRAIKSFERLASLDVSGLAAGLQSLNGVDLSRISELSTAFQTFASALAGSDRIAAGTTKILTALAQLAQSANNIPAVISALPGLSSAIHDYLSVMAGAPAVEAGTVSLVTALGNLANAGAKATRTAAALPGLTAGVQAFIQTMASMPRLDKNILRAVEALARLADAGGRAGAASRNLLQNINHLSGGMGGLRSGALGATGGLRSFTGQLLAALGITGGLYGVVRAVKASVTTFSDLIEVENVVDKSFGEMASKMEKLAKISISDFGMSELTAKQIASRYQAMGVAMGFAQDEMSDMSIELTKLAADMASFYNVKQEDVAKSLESVFTGTTKPLRAYGLDLTQATLQEWALKQGIDADVKSMSQAEKTLLRYQFVMEQTKNISGDFRDTQGSFANQTRILIEQFKELGSVLGGGLVAALLPAVKGLNLLLSKIIQVAKAISSFLSGLLGIKKATIGAGAGLAGVADTADSVTDNLDSVAGGIGNVGGSAKKAKKDLNGFIAGWQEVTNMSTSDSGTGGGAGDVSMPDMSLTAEYDFKVSAQDEASPILEGIRRRFEELRGLFMKGFRFGLGDVSVFDCIQNHIKNIKSSFLEIVTDGEVVTAFNHMLDVLTFNLGAKVGAFTSIGASIADNILGGLDLYLGEAKERIKTWLINVFDITGETDTIVSNFTVAVADVFTVFRSDDAKQITSDIIQLFADGFMGVTELAGKLGRDVLGLLLNPLTENAAGFKEALQNTLSPIAEMTGTIADSFTRLWNTVRQTYDEHIGPMFQAFSEGISQIIGTLLNGYNEHIAPVLGNLAAKFTETWQGTIEPLLSNFIGLFGDVADFVTVVWTNTLQPVVNWIASAIMPAVAPVLNALGNAFIITFETIGKIFDGFITSCRGVLQFLVGTFSGDWSKMWTGIKNIFKGIWDMLPDFMKEPVRAIIGSVNKMIEAIEGGINFVIRGLGQLRFDVPDWIPGIGGESFKFSLNEISLPRIPQLAKGGILDKATLALIGESGKEAVLPLERNTGWISNLSEQISNNITRDFGNIQPDYSIPVVEEYSRRYSESDMGRLKSTLQMEMDEKMAQMAYENRQLRDAVEQNTQILEKILERGIVLDDNEFTGRYKRAATKFMDKNHYEMGLYPAGR